MHCAPPKACNLILTFNILCLSKIMLYFPTSKHDYITGSEFDGHLYSLDQARPSAKDIGREFPRTPGISLRSSLGLCKENQLTQVCKCALSMLLADM